MTTIDGVPGRWRLRLPGVAQAPAEALAAAEGCTVPELVAQLILDAAAKIATDAATSSAGAVSTGQGTAASTPAPTNGRAAYALDLYREGERLAREADRLTAMKAAGHVPAHVHLDGGPCVYGERCDQ